MRRVLFVILALLSTPAWAQVYTYPSTGGSGGLDHWPKPLNKLQVTLSAAQMDSLYSSPITLLAGKSGYFYDVFQMVIVKEDTVAFSSVGQNLTLSWNASPAVSIFTWAVTSWLTSTNVGSARWGRLGQPQWQIDEAAANLGGKGLVLSLPTGDMTGGGPCTVYIWYWQVPDTSAGLAGL